MSITFLIGNGFDLGFGINTSYSSFLDYYLQIDTSDTDIKIFKERIKNARNDEVENKWADCEIAKGEDTRNYDEGVMFLKCWGDFFSELLGYLKAECDRIDEDGYADYCAELKRSLIGFDQALTPKDGDIVRNNPRYYKQENIIFSFISFNYTDCLDKCVDKLGNTTLKEWYSGGTRRAYISTVVHPHGCMTGGNYIFGVNDASQVANQALLEDADIEIDIIKHSGNSSCKNYQEDEAIEIIKQSDLIFIYGMSLGKTDKLWWARIGNWLCASADHLLIIQQHKSITMQSPIWAQVSSERETKKLFFSLTDLSDEEIEAVQTQVIVTFQPAIFRFEQHKEKYVR